MFFQNVYDQNLAQASYFLGCKDKKQAIVIDPQRDISYYLEIAKQQNLTITHVVETHIHADFLAGTPELAAETGAQIYLSAEGGTRWQYEYSHNGLRQGDFIKVGNLSLEVMHTPGHTPESISLLLRDHPASDEPVMIFTGDFVFVGDVGRPDLLEEAAGIQNSKHQSARKLFESLKKFTALPDFVQVWPGHGAGSACGKALGGVPSSTVGYEKLRNWALQYGDDVEGFTNELLAGQPEVPTYFSRMKIWNKQNRPLYAAPNELHQYTIEQLEGRTDIVLLDSRDKTEYAAGHIGNSINIQNKKSMVNWAGWMLDYSKQIVVIAPVEQQQEIVRKLSLIGMDNVVGFVSDISGASLIRTELVDDVKVANLKDEPDVVLMDVRNASEYHRSHIPGAEHFFVGHLPKMERLRTIADKTFIIQCQSGDRASIAYSYLESIGFKNLKLYMGSFVDWESKGRTVTN
ncbi:MAG: MBL fold metallo-hydrolase [Sphingobacterium sp.]|uniref:MBL fold metallo-hydrolase n=1 Tax=Sphingobacterium sp. JB170 TaxID=1434842 RepID=UPI00097EB96D|nr:MBL fold metallo-hydrolase [Sphingobacterium sp. JB170]SJN44917.1 Zn-dependent hydroxyacylglutathione hydrolase / Polysulfide binding protein [Sphingobacterium sp. JB170]